jgi:NitT/TauT family transport system substrate-binding protein
LKREPAKPENSLQARFGNGYVGANGVRPSIAEYPVLQQPHAKADGYSPDERRRQIRVARPGSIVMVRVVLLLLIIFSGLSQAQEAQKVRVGLGYLPDVQFAPFYLGVVQGLYEKQGLEVEFQHGFVTELYPLLAQGKLDFVVGDAEDVMSLPIETPFKYLMAMYQKVPNALFSLADKNIKTIQDLKGKRIGIPGMFGSSYTSLQAVLQAAGLTEQDVTLEQIGFTQLEAVLSNRVDVAMGFINNEPIVLKNQGVDINVIDAGMYNPAPGNGIMTSEAVFENPDLVKRFISASQEALAVTIQDPQKAFDASKQYVENLGDDRMEVLMTSIALYSSDYTREMGLGFTSPEGWQKTLELLTSTGRVTTDLPAAAFYSNAFLTSGVGNH